MKTLFKQLTSIDTLHAAWKMVRSKGRAGGVDGITIKEYDSELHKNLLKLRYDLLNRKWKPQPYLRVSIPKKSNERRLLGLLSINDKVVQQAIKNLVEPSIERLFISNSYGYRAGKGPAKAIKRLIYEFNNRDNSHLVRFDIDNFFDRIDREKLMSRVKDVIDDFEVCRLIDLSLRMGVVTKGLKWIEAEYGVPQGAILSPVLANLYLHDFDRFITSKTKSYVRYADDFIVVCKSEQEAKKIQVEAEQFLRDELSQSLNPTSIIDVGTGVEFLGIFVRRGEISITAKKQHDIFSKIESIELESDGRLAQKSIEILHGVQRYYGQLIDHSLLEQFDIHLLNKLEGLMVNIPNLHKRIVGNLVEDVPLFTTENQINKKQVFETLFSRAVQRISDKSIKKAKKIISSRKLEYQRLESEGSDLVISNYGYSIGLHNDTIVVKKSGVVKERLSSNLRHITILSDGVSISTNAIRHCAKNGIPIYIFDERFKHSCTLMSQKFMSHSHWLQQNDLSQERKFNIAKRIIMGKIKNQYNLIKYYHKYHKNNYDLEHGYQEYTVKVTKILDLLKNIELPKERLYQDALMTFEAQAALAYWSYVRELVSDDEVGFESREQRGAKDLMNSLLNYGYALIYPRVWQSLLAARLNPYSGLVHYQEGNPNLLFDVMELFRTQAVDRVVISLIQKRQPLVMKDGLLDADTRQLLTKSVFSRLARYENYRGRNIRFESIMKCQANELVTSIVEDVIFRPYLAKW